MKKYFKTHPSLLKTFLFTIVLLALWLPRGLALDRFVTVDEPRWLMRSANFYRALYLGNLIDTFQKEHPGVTIMWTGTAGFLWRFPGYAKVAEKQLKNTYKLENTLEVYKHNSLEILEASRFLVVLAIVTVLVLAFLYAVKLIGVIPALVGFVLIAFDSYSIALSRLLHPDALLSPLMFLSLLAFMSFLYRGHHLTDLIMSTIATGLAWLTKSPSFFLVPFFGLLSIVEIGRAWRLEGQLSLRAAWKFIWPFLVWGGIAALVFVILWPAMWVDPVGSLRLVFGEALNYAAEGHHAASYFNGQIFKAGISDWRFYPVNYLWRTTPVILIGLLLTGFAFILQRRLSFPKEQRQAALILLLFAVLYTIFMTTGDKKFDRYLLPVFAPLALVAGIGWVTIAQNLLKGITSQWITVAKAAKIALLGTATLLIIIMIIQAIGPLQTYPYYFTYYNPLMGGNKRAPEVMMIGWGEGLDQAARYLNAKPESNTLRVQSWYPVGPFSYFFEGTTLYDEFMADPERLEKADYYVLYFHLWQRQRPSEEFIQYFDQQVPEHIVYIDGLEYARIYLRAAMTPPSQSN
jgi:hypothetical protein